MKITKALITADSPDQRKLPLQTLVDRDRKTKTVLEILINEIRTAGIEKIGIVIQPDDEKSFEQVIDSSLFSSVTFIHQTNNLGYGGALLSSKQFLDNEPFLHLVGDHLYVNRSGENVAKRLLQVAEKHKCTVSAVQATRENEIGNFGTIKALRLQGESSLFQVNKVKEKPTPTYAEQHLMVPGFRAGYYLCFFGMHVFTPLLIELLEKNASESPGQKLGLSEILNELAKRSKYLALQKTDSRYDIGQDYGLLKAQLALSLTGKDRDYLLSELLQFFIEKDLTNNGDN